MLNRIACLENVCKLQKLRMYTVSHKIIIIYHSKKSILTRHDNQIKSNYGNVSETQHGLVLFGAGRFGAR